MECGCRECTNEFVALYTASIWVTVNNDIPSTMQAVYRLGVDCWRQYSTVICYMDCADNLTVSIIGHFQFCLRCLFYLHFSHMLRANPRSLADLPGKMPTYNNPSFYLLVLSGSYGTCSVQGSGRAAMEDTKTVEEDASGTKFFAVFDGHGGKDVSEWAQQCTLHTCDMYDTDADSPWRDYGWTRGMVVVWVKGRNWSFFRIRISIVFWSFFQRGGVTGCCKQKHVKHFSLGLLEALPPWSAQPVLWSICLVFKPCLSA